MVNQIPPIPDLPPSVTLENTNMTANLALQTETLFNPAISSGPGSIKFDQSQLVQLDRMKTEITDYIRLRMGDEIVDVEFDKSHVDMAIKQALIRYRQRSSRASEESYVFLEVYPETQDYILPREIEEVNVIYRRGIGNGSASATQFEPFSSGFLNTYMLVAGRVGGLVNYELFAAYQKLTMMMFGGYLDFTWNRVTKRLTILRKFPGYGVPNTSHPAETVMLHVNNYKPDVMLLNDQISFPWIQDYAYAFILQTVGEAREKFSTINGPGGGTSLNGAALKAQAKEIFERLEKELITYVDARMPLGFVIG